MDKSFKKHQGYRGNQFKRANKTVQDLKIEAIKKSQNEGTVEIHRQASITEYKR